MDWAAVPPQGPAVLLLAVFCMASDCGAQAPGLAEALSLDVAVGRRIEVPGPPSTRRHPAPDDPQRANNSVASSHAFMQARRDLPGGVYQECRKDWLTTRHAGVDLHTFAGKAMDLYEEKVLSQVSTPWLTRVEVEPMTLVYPAGYSGNAEPVEVRARRLELHAIDASGDPRHVTAYFLNYDKVDPGMRRVVLQVNGHVGTEPSRMAIGLRDRGGITGAAVTAIALEGHPVITYDDHNVGESSPSTGTENGLHRTLANLRLLDDALLVRFDRVDVIGLSGGTERLYHFFMFNRCPIFSAYLAGFFSSTWMPLDSMKSGRGPFSTNPDTHNEEYLRHFQRVDHVLVAVAHGIDVRLASQTFEGGRGKECLYTELLPALRGYTDLVSLGGDDPDGDGVSNDGRNLAHEYDLPDYFSFLDKSLAAPRPPAQFLVLVDNVPPDGLALLELDFTGLAQHLGVLPLKPSALSAVTGPDHASVDCQWIPAPDFSAQSRVVGRALVQLPRGGDHEVILTAGVGSSAGGARYHGSGGGGRSTDGIQYHGSSFTMRHDASSGGFPARIEFAGSGNVYTNHVFNERVHSKTDGGYFLRNDGHARVEVVSRGPLAMVVRTQARYLQALDKVSNAWANYDWHYLDGKPWNLVVMDVIKENARSWDELHVLELNFPDESFTRWAGGEPLNEGVFTAEKGFHAPTAWGALMNDDDGIGMFWCGGPRVYDGRGEYGTYLHAHGETTWQAWSDRRRRLYAGIWLGPAARTVEAVRTLQARPPVLVRSVMITQRLQDRLNDRAKGSPREANFIRRQVMQGRPMEAIRMMEQESIGGLHEIVAGELGIVLQERDDGMILGSVNDAATGREFLADAGPALFVLKLRELPTGRDFDLGSESGWTACDVRRDAETWTLVWTGAMRPGLEELTVTATAVVDDEACALRWRLTVENVSRDYTLLEVGFPQLAVAPLGEDGKVFFPRAPGEVEEGLWGRDFQHEGLYPEPWTTMQYVAAYQADGKAGLYLAHHDPMGGPKRIRIQSRADQRAVTFTYAQPVADMTLPGNRHATRGEVVWQLFRGDWFDASVIYRDWVRGNATWFPGLSEQGRDDTPRWMKELPVWVNGGGHVGKAASIMEQVTAYMDVPVGIHWYGWHLIPFDNDYPHYFPPIGGFVEAVKKVQDSGAYVMPYINGRLWDTRDRKAEDFEFTSVAKPGATKNEAGEVYTESYGSREEDGTPVELAVMCPYTELWQKKVHEICMRLFTECGVDAVYIDQIAAMSPKLCMDRTHGHPLGGGTWWNEGYWKMLEAIRADMPAGRMLTTECNSEPFAHVLDGYLSWTWQHDGQVPAFMVVYGGALQVFGRQYGGDETARRMKWGQQFVFGEQLGWIAPQNLMNESEPTKAFYKAVAKVRWKLRDYFAHGRMERPPRLICEMPTVTSNWAWGGSKDWFVTTDAVMTGAWAIPDEGRVVLLFVNVTDQFVAATLNFDGASYGLTGKQVTRTEHGARTTVTPREIESEFEEKIRFAPLAAWAIELTE